MTLRIEWVDWVDGKRHEVACGNPEPLSIQANIAALSQRLWKAEATLEQVRRYADNAGFPDDTEVRYAQGCNDVLNDVRRILDGGDADE